MPEGRGGDWSAHWQSKQIKLGFNVKELNNLLRNLKSCSPGRINLCFFAINPAHMCGIVLSKKHYYIYNIMKWVEIHQLAFLTVFASWCLTRTQTKSQQSRNKCLDQFKIQWNLPKNLYFNHIPKLYWYNKTSLKYTDPTKTQLYVPHCNSYRI